MRVIAVYNIKGGVGKTATAVNLAYLSAAAGARTLLWDLDPQGAATFYFRVRPKVKGGVRRLIRGRKPIARFARETDYPGLDLLPADFSYRNLDLALERTAVPRRKLADLLGPLDETYDHVWLDCAPSISLVSEGVFFGADALLVPTIPTTLSLRTLEQIDDHLAREGPKGLRVLPFYCMVDRRKSLHREVCAAASRGSYRFLDSSIPYSSIVEQMGSQRAPVAVFAAGSEAELAYERLWHEVMERTGSLWAGLGRLQRVLDRLVGRRRPARGPELRGEAGRG